MQDCKNYCIINQLHKLVGECKECYDKQQKKKVEPKISELACLINDYSYDKITSDEFQQRIIDLSKKTINGGSITLSYSNKHINLEEVNSRLEKM